MDMEKVIKGLECCLHNNDCKNCPYKEEYDPNFDCIDRTRKDAIELLKEYKRQDGCPCTHCTEWECDEVCDEYKKWRDT